MSQRNRLNTRRTAGGACLVMIAALGIATATEPANQPPEPEEKATDPQPAPASVTEHVTVEARKDDLTGIASSAADGATGAEDLSRRPILRSGEIVETVPGSVATQHSGGGKANQYFLRGFNLETKGPDAGLLRRGADSDH